MSSAKMHHYWMISSITLLAAISPQVQAAKEDNNGLVTGITVRHDTSPPLSEMLITYELNQSQTKPVKPAEFEIPNIFDIPPSPAEIQFKPQPAGPRGGGGSNGLPSPTVDMSVDGFDANDNIAVVGGVPLPPDTNGDVGINFYIQYVNLGWKIIRKDTGAVEAGPFAGNTFWTGFGGPCETNNAGDPIVLYDKNEDRWVFSQFTSSSNPDGRQCFAISTTNDPQGPYHRYEFVFPGEFNDYPHIGIWDDESGDRSGYYFVTHDFFDVGGPNQSFMQASYAVVERDQMLQGLPAQFVRFTDTNFLGATSFGAQPAHLESIKVAPSGMCNPFVLGRPDLQGYQVVDLCVDWNNVGNSTLSTPFVVDAGESWTPGPGSVSQPGTGATLDTLAFFGRIMYRSSFRAYPVEKGLEDTLAFSFPVDMGGGQAGVRWAQLNFPEVGDPVVVNQGEYAPDSTDRWMSGISVDQDGNLGLAYSAANSAQNVFPGVRFTTRNHADPANTLRDESVCVDGGGSQTSGSGRWGDYSSVSVDPVDECTFWATVEYMPTTGNAVWSNRVCSFKVDSCGQPSFSVNVPTTSAMSVCSATDDSVIYDFGLAAFNGFSDTVTVGLSGEPVGSTVSFPGGTAFNTFPASGTFEISGLLGEASAEYVMTLTGTAPGLTSDQDYLLSISDAATTDPATLIFPADESLPIDLIFANAFEELSLPVDSYPTFSWLAVSGALEYRLEVATDSGFTSPVIDVVTDELFYLHDQPLATDTTYYWRVTGLNNCGGGVISVVNEFTTGSFVSGTPAECANGTVANVVYFDDMEGDVSPWSQPAAPVGTNTWGISAARSFSGNAWFAVDTPVASDQYLVTPPINLPGIAESPLSLSYWNFQELETDAGSGASACWDGGLLEISTDGGNNYSQIQPAQLLGDQYNGQITSNPASPISGRQAWCASSAVPAAGDQADIAVVDLDDYAGQTVQFRFRLGTDSAVGAEGWYLDNITVQGCQ